MKSYVAALILLLSSSAQTAAIDGYVYAVGLVNESTFKFKLYCGYLENGYPYQEKPSSGGAGYYFVSADQVGATMYDKMHAQLLSALNNQLRVYIDYDGSNYVTDVLTFALHVWEQPSPVYSPCAY